MGATERVLQFIKYKGVTKYKFCKELGFSNKFLDNSSNMGTDKACKILRYYSEINPGWLLTGEGEMLKNSVILEAPSVKEAIDYKEKYYKALENNQDLNKDNRLLYKENISLRSEIDNLQKVLLDNNLGTNDMNRSVG
ncbi:peptidase S24 [Tenacibaculum finnmarkense genomovar finnmarkense]|uniref:Peptidase S24 n=1 Tax=Tenacibaculum piscium TaxID=1458515 RepID=A0A2H1YH88_9FLAO|nr:MULTISPECIES: peptidase S24 [Tenacibaculum]MCD8418444.1 peptidase S24 [Tenacibaculum finnmarkense genomovar finnmarkense]MCG8186720.1 peptidase S24 [Tenacibaculum finnmarkense genomovar finnmarkense]MCG8203254.1 peptidase S24 [Tenacibaculum finnmarkense genomovar finnmarkense]MCG8210627.1 peptidase S24 [Tenacibaculum finnmarkense genomovar finnmarkense]MCG8213480.1 peptidase S24 [Tenacibaculum finnmarkense genomovar finnmarkense]